MTRRGAAFLALPHPMAPDRHRGDRTTRWFVIGFAIVEAVILGWALFSGRIG